MNKQLRIFGIGAALSGVLALAGCGGSDDTPPVTSQVPADASTSIGGFIGYLKALVVSSADNLDPVDVSMVTPPTDETSDPAPID